MDIEKQFVYEENRLLTDKFGFKLATVSPLDEHFKHILIHSVHIFNKEMFLHILSHFKFLLKKRKTSDVGSYLLKKYGK